MDPLSIVASVSALVALARGCIKVIAGLRQAMGSTPVELSALINDISDLESVLSKMAPLSQGQPVDKTEEGLLSALQSHIARATAQLQMLHDLIQESLPADSKMWDRTKANIFFMRKRERMLQIQMDLGGTRQNLNLALNILNVSSVKQVGLQVHAISAQQNTDAGVLAAILSQVSMLQHSLDPSKDLQLFPRSTIAKLIQNNVSPTNYPDESRTERNNSGSHELISITTRSRLLRKVCRPWCSCICHAKRSIKTPAFWKNVLGSVFVGYSGVPVLTPACDETSCLQRTTFGVDITYYFPMWLISRAISVNLSASTFGTPELSLRMPRMVSWAAPLWNGARIGDQIRVEMLFSEGNASPYDVNAYGQSSLHYAIRFKHLHLANFLIGQGADMMLQDENGRKPMDTAWEHILSKSVTNEQAGILKNIFNDSEYLISREFTPLHKIVLGLARGSLVDELSMSTKGINTVDANGRTSLSWAAARGDHKASQALLDAGADPRIPDYENISPLFHAIKRSDVEGTRLLINHGADATKREVNGGTAIHVACLDHDNPEMLELLSSANVDVNAIDFDGDPVLHYTAWADFHNSAAKLLELGADPYIRNVSGDSIVHMAIYHRAYKVLSVLLEYGVRMDAMTVQRQTILHSACETPNAKILSVLATADLESVDFEAMDTRGKKYDDCFRDRADPDDEELWDAFHSLVQHVQDLSHGSQTIKAPVEGEKGEGDDEQEEVIEMFYDAQEMV